MSYLNELAERRPDLFKADEVRRLTAAKRWSQYEAELTQREQSFVAEEKRSTTLDGRTRKLIAAPRDLK